jgi:hypothetical protein
VEEVDMEEAVGLGMERKNCATPYTVPLLADALVVAVDITDSCLLLWTLVMPLGNGRH